MTILSGIFNHFQSISRPIGTNAGSTSTSTAAENDATAATAVSPRPNQPSMLQSHPPHRASTSSSSPSYPPPALPISASPSHPSHPRKRPPTPEAGLQSKRPRRHASISADEKRLFGDFTNPPDAVQAPDPRLYFYGQTLPGMKTKPGSAHSHKPVNTLQNGSSHQTPRQRTAATYGSKGQASHSSRMQEFASGYLDDQADPPPRQQSEIIPSPSKRIKTHHVPSSQTEVINLDADEDDSIDVRKSVHGSDSSLSTVPPSFSSRSHASNNSGGRPLHIKGSFSQNSYADTCDRLDPTSNRKAKPRHAKLTLLAQPGPPSHPSTSRNKSYSQKASLTASPDIGKQHPRSESIEVDLDFTPKYKQKSYLVSDEDSEDELQSTGPVESHHSQSQANILAHVTPSTSTRKNAAFVSRREMDDSSENLHTKSARVLPRTGSKDESGIVHGDLPRVKMDQTRSAVQSLRGKNTAGAIPKWPLSYARTHGFQPRGLKLYLCPSLNPTTRGFDILEESDGGSCSVACSINTRKITSARDDDVSMIRLQGPKEVGKNAHCYDLEFCNQNELRSFRNEYLIKDDVIKKSFTKDEDAMRKIFSAPDFWNDKANVSISKDDQELELIVARSKQNQHQLVPPTPKRLIDRLNPEYPALSAPQESISRRESSATNEQKSNLQSSRPVRTTRSTRTTHNADIETSQPNVYKYSEMEGLGVPWSRPVQYGEGRRRALVEFDDLTKLDDDEMLNDALVDFYLIYLFDQAKLPEKTVYFFNTHFFTSLTRSSAGQKGDINYENVSKWVKEDIFAYDFVVVPVCENLHWYLAIICNVSEIARKYIGDNAGQDSLASGADANPERAMEAPAADDNGSPASQAPLDAGRTITSDGSDVNLFEEKHNSMRSPQDMDGHLDSPEPRVDQTREGSLEETSRLQRLSIDEAEVGETVATETGEATTEGRSTVTMDDSESNNNPVSHTVMPPVDEKSGTHVVETAVSGPVSVKKKARRKPTPVRKYPLREPIILILDSMGHTHPKTCKVLKEYIAQEALQKRSMDAQINQKLYVKEAHIPLQNNFTDCGVYLLGYWRKFVSNPREFVDRILSREMHPETDWPDMTTNTIRSDMRNVLRDLASEQEKTRKLMKAKKKLKPMLAPSGEVNEPVEPPNLMPKLSPSVKLESSNSRPPVGIQSTGVGRESQPTGLESPGGSKKSPSPQVVIKTGTSSQQSRKQSMAVTNPKEEFADASRNSNEAVTKTRVSEENPGRVGRALSQGREDKLQASQKPPLTHEASQPLSRTVTTALDLRGSSQDPISIEDSQETVQVENSSQVTKRLDGSFHPDKRTTSSQPETHVAGSLMANRGEANSFNNATRDGPVPSDFTVHEGGATQKGDLFEVRDVTHGSEAEEERGEEVPETPEPPEVHEID